MRLSEAARVDGDGELHPVPPCMGKLLEFDRHVAYIIEDGEFYFPEGTTEQEKSIAKAVAKAKADETNRETTQ